MTKKQIYRFGVELKEGCTIRGAEQAIEALENQGISFDEILTTDKNIMEEFPLNLLDLPKILDLNQRLKKAVRQAKANDYFPLTFGGDHALAIGTISAISNTDTAVFWVDAHGDNNTEKTTVSGRIHGMPLAVLQGDGVKELTDLVDTVLNPKRIVLFGIRSLDEEEEKYIKDQGIRMFRMSEIREKGLEASLQEAFALLKPYDVHLSFDLDSIDPQECRGVNTPVRGGFTAEEAYLIMEESLEKLEISSLDIVEYNPLFDEGNTIQIVKKLNRIINNQKGV